MLQALKTKPARIALVAAVVSIGGLATASAVSAQDSDDNPVVSETDNMIVEDEGGDQDRPPRDGEVEGEGSDQDRPPRDGEAEGHGHDQDRPPHDGEDCDETDEARLDETEAGDKPTERPERPEGPNAGPEDSLDSADDEEVEQGS